MMIFLRMRCGIPTRSGFNSEIVFFSMRISAIKNADNSFLVAYFIPDIPCRQPDSTS
jgi:hypothetical protein